MHEVVSVRYNKGVIRPYVVSLPKDLAGGIIRGAVSGESRRSGAVANRRHTPVLGWAQCATRVVGHAWTLARISYQDV